MNQYFELIKLMNVAAQFFDQWHLIAVVVFLIFSNSFWIYLYIRRVKRHEDLMREILPLTMKLTMLLELIPRFTGLMEQCAKNQPKKE